MAVKLYSTTYCPYAWSVRIVLNEKGVPFDVFEVDLKNKQAEFLSVSPTAKVPVLCDGATKIWESMVINEYLEEKYPEPNLLGENPEERAAVRTTVIDLNWSRSLPLAKLASVLFYGSEKKDDERVRRQVRLWYQFLDELDEHFAEDDWLTIGRFSVADINLYATVSVSVGFGMRLGERAGLHGWLARMNGRASVRRSAPEALPQLM